MAQRIRVGVLFGGRSCEHEVSLLSARAIVDAIDRARFEVIPIGVTKQGRWVRLQDPQLSVDRPVGDNDGSAVTLLPSPTGRGLTLLEERSTAAPIAIDVVFPIIHGPMGEDGTVQGLFELADIPYVGAGVLGSAVGMDKAVMKALFEHAGLPVTPYRVVLRQRWRDDPQAVRRDCERAFALPWFVKPANMGSSVGVSKVRTPEDFTRAMNLAAQYDRKLLIEQAVEDAREIEIAVLGNDAPSASVPGEIFPSNEFYDYNAKYIDGESGLAIPAELPETLSAQLQDYALQAFRALDAAGLARVDFLVRRRDQRIFLLEANTLPGFTPISMYPKLWQASGIPYAQLIERLIALALERHRDRHANQTSYLAMPT